MTITSEVPVTGNPVLSARSIERSLRFWAGVILMTYVTTHLLNHALGLFGVALMTEVQQWRVAIWRSWPGTVLMLGSILVHVVLTIKRTLSRRTWRMPKLEALQIAFGLIIPYMLVQHVVGTRVIHTLIGIDDTYTTVLKNIWPHYGLWQSVTLVIVWTHGVIGLYFVFRTKPWFRQMQTALLLASVCIPLLALAGFVASGREAMSLAASGRQWTEAELTTQYLASVRGDMAVKALLGLIVAGILARFLHLRFRASVGISYTGHGQVTSPKGLTLLEISRRSQIPHPSICGGRGRCASCRVLVLGGLDTLPPPSGMERKMLDRIRAPQQVRLACQIKPMSDLQVRVLLPSQTRMLNQASFESGLDWGTEAELTVLFADVRGFSALARNQMPSDTVVLLNRVIAELSQATEAHGGRVASVETDGILAVFGLGERSRTGARAAIDAAADMLKAMTLANRDFGVTMPQPLRIGIGIHTGPIIATRIGDVERGYQLMVIGEAVVAANRLEEATKELGADCIVSRATLLAAGLAAEKVDFTQIHYKNGETPVPAQVFSELDDLTSLFKLKSGALKSPAEAQSPA